MFYFIVIFIIVSVYLMKKSANNRAVRYSTLTMSCFVASLLVFVMYISRDSFYYNVIDNLFLIPLFIWQKLMFLSVSPELLICLLNFFVLAVIFFSIQFSFSYITPRIPLPYSLTILGILTAEWVLYAPAVYRRLYLALYPDHLTYRQFTALYETIHIGTALLNTALILLALVLLWRNYRNVSRIKIIKVSTLGISICHTLIMFSFFLLFSYYPAPLIKVSKIAGIVSYQTAPILVSKWFTLLFPCYLLVSFVLICFCLWQTVRVSVQLKDNNFTISKEISAADTSSKAFCHYLKNEILAIQSEIEILDAANEEQAESFREIEQRCSALYERLDLLYRSSKFSSLTLKETELKPVLLQLTENFSHELQDVNVSLNVPKEPVVVMLDETWFYQALHNIVANALDAMSELPPAERTLSLSLEYVDSYVCICIADSGKGISPEDMPQIFTPFYSSHPIRTHWGIGLSVTYKIVTAHEGHIDIKSKVGEGTSVKILLPQLHPRTARDAAKTFS